MLRISFRQACLLQAAMFGKLLENFPAGFLPTLPTSLIFVDMLEIAFPRETPVMPSQSPSQTIG